MKESFENKLHQFRDVIETPNRENTDLDPEKLEVVKEWAIKTAAEKTNTPLEIQEHIFSMQQQKQEMMDYLKEDLRLLDAGDYDSLYSNEGSLVLYRDGILFSGESEITLGKLITDIDWGVSHHLDASVPRAIHKKYLVERVKSRIYSLLDEQIIEEELNSPFTNDSKKHSYKSLSSEFSEDREAQSGHIAERMVKCLLKKIAIDMPDAGFDIIEADVEQDVNRKIDFILAKKDHNRGAGIEAKEIQGIQFTINPKNNAFKHKINQIKEVKKNEIELNKKDHIKDIVLVQVPINDVMGKYNAWSRLKKSGGPDDYWSTETKIKIIENILRGFLDQDSIDKIKQNIWEKENGTLKVAA
jgi:hypothetical protein